MAASTRTALADGHKYLGAFVVVVALFSVSTSLHAQNLYGSMAFAQTGDGGYAGGIAWDAQSRAKARQLAIDECRWAGGGSACREVGWFRNACGAIAIGDGDGYGTGWGDSSDDAERAALSECRSQNNTCHIEITRCTELSVAVGIDRATRRRIQLALAAQGFDPGPADGIFGQKTQAALRAWQAAKGYATTGNLTSEQARILQSLQPQRAKASVKPSAPKKKADVLWGSIAFSQNPDRGHAWAIVWNSDGTTEAERISLEVCRREGGESCQQVGWFRNACGALAIGDGNGFGAGWGATTTQAEQDALEKCRAANQDCRIEVSRCSDKPDESSGVAMVPSKQEPVVVLEPKCPIVNRDRLGTRQCWMELANNPGCHVWIYPYQNGDYQWVDSATWSGTCSDNTATGQGTLVWSSEIGTINETGAPWIAHNTGKGLMSNGKQQGHWEEIRDTSVSSSKVTRNLVDTYEGSYKDGKRGGPWHRSSTHVEITKNGTYESEAAENGSYMDGEKHGRWTTKSRSKTPSGQRDKTCWLREFSRGKEISIVSC